MFTPSDHYLHFQIVDSIAVGLLQNTAILLCLSLLYEIIWLKREVPGKIEYKILAGLVIGCISIILMYAPWTWTQGIVFDTRSVLLSVSGLFFGVIPTAIAIIIAAAMRILSGGGGMWMGVVVIITSGTIGVLWQRFRHDWQQNKPYIELFTLGLIVHLIMLLCTAFLPFDTIIPTVKVIALPLLTIYTPATMLLGLLLLHQRKNFLNRMAITQLHESEIKFRKLFENHSAVKLIIDPVTADIVDANTAAAQFYGYSREELKKMNISDINTLSCSEIQNVIDRILGDPKINFEFIHRCKDGTLKDVEVFSSMIDMSGKAFLHSIVHDITEKREAINYIILLSKAIEQLPVSVVITDASGVIRFINPKFAEVTGYSKEMAIGKKASIVKSGKQDKEFYKAMWNTISAGKDWKGEIQNKRKDCSVFWESVYISPLFASSGKITHYVAVKEDITDKKRLMAELVTAKEKAVESDKLKTSFLMNMSHEIRTPLNGILGFANILVEEPKNPETTREYASIIQQSGVRLLNLLNDLVDISKIEAGIMTVAISKVSPEILLHEVVQQLKNQAIKKGIQIRMVVPEEASEYTIRTDPFKLNQILVNLVNNAIKFSEKGTIECGFYLNDDALVYFVKDQGVGIPEEMQDQVFKRFFQVKNKTIDHNDGVGLGLTICKALVELLKGDLWLESEVDKGSSFFVSLPMKR